VPDRDLRALHFRTPEDRCWSFVETIFEVPLSGALEETPAKPGFFVVVD
jgi:hypothetical protein